MIKSIIHKGVNQSEEHYNLMLSYIESGLNIKEWYNNNEVDYSLDYIYYIASKEGWTSKRQDYYNSVASDIIIDLNNADILDSPTLYKELKSLQYDLISKLQEEDLKPYEVNHYVNSLCKLIKTTRLISGRSEQNILTDSNVNVKSVNEWDNISPDEFIAMFNEEVE